MADFLVPQWRLGQQTPSGTLPGFNAQAPVEAFGVSGRVLQESGREAMVAGDRMARTVDHQLDLQNEAEAKDADSRFAGEVRNLLFDPEKGYFAQRGEGAVKGGKPVLDQIEKLRSQYSSSIKSPAAQRAFDNVARTRVAAVDDQVQRHVLVERKHWADNASGARQQALLDDVGNSVNDPKLLMQTITGLRNEAVQASLDKGEAPIVAVQKGREAQSKGIKAAVISLSLHDPMRAKAFFDQNIGAITTEDRISVEHMLQTRVSQQAGANVSLVLNGISTGVLPYDLKVQGFESGGNDKAKNPDSGAAGRFQFTDQTWLTHAKKVLPEAKLMTDAEILNLRSDKNLSKVVFDAFTKDNEVELQKAGIPVSDTTRYLAHWFGAKGAESILKGDPNTPIESLLPSGKTPTGKSWAEANGIAGKTAGQVVSIAMQRMGEGRATGGEPQKPNLGVLINAALGQAGPKVEDQAKAVEHAMTIYRGQVEIANKAQAAAEHELKLQGEEADKKLTDLGNKVTETDVKSYRQVLSPAQYGAWMAKARGEDAQDDPRLATDFRMRAATEDIEKDLYDARKNRQLSQQSFDQLLGLNRQYMRDDKPGSPFKSGREFVKNLLDPGILTDQAAMAIGRVAQAKAVAEFDTWMVKNPGADRAQTMEAADAIARRFATVQTQDLSIALPVPRFYPDSTKAAMQTDKPEAVEEKLRRSAATIRAELDAGRITPEDAAKEFKTIEQWQAIQKMRANQTPGKKP